jgi:outer membrane protein TolC
MFMKIRRNNTGTFLLLLAFPAAGLSQDSTRPLRHAFSVQQAIDYAKKNNVQVKNALLDVQKQEQINREVTSNALPHINAQFSYTYNPAVQKQLLPDFITNQIYTVLTDEGVSGSGGPIQFPDNIGFLEFPFGTKFNTAIGISLRQILFDGQVFVGLQARNATIELQQKTVEVTEEMIRTSIYKIYYQLVVSKTQLELLNANIGRFEKLLHDTREIYKAGFAEQLDVDKVSVALTNLQTERIRVLNSVSNGYYGLKVLIGMPVNEELALTDSLDESTIREGILEMSTYSYEDRKDFQSALLGKKLNEYNVRRYKLSQIPTVTLTGNYAKNAQRNQWNFLEGGEWFDIASVNLNVSIPIFNGFFTKAKIEQARIDLLKTTNLIENMKLTIDSEVATARNNFNTAIATLEFQRKNMELAEKVYMQTTRKYEMGTGSQTEITTAQTDLKAAQTNYITALYDAVIARIDFLKATGKL